MAVSVVEVWLLLLLTISAAGNLSQFYSIVRIVGGIDPTKLVTYGCYCGLGNTRNNKVVDCLDMCCFHHDNCIENLKNPCPRQYSLGSFAKYQLNDSLHCVSDQEQCSYRLCTCDYEFGVCVSKYKRLHKDECTSVRNDLPCRLPEGYAMPDCKSEEIEQMIETTRNSCFVPQVDTTTGVVSSTVTTSTIKLPTTTSTTPVVTTEEGRTLVITMLPSGSNNGKKVYLHEAFIISLLTLLLAPMLLA